MASCPHCQTPLPDPDAARCPSCGGVVSRAAEPTPIAAADAGPPPLPAGSGREDTGQAGGHAPNTGGYAHPPGPPPAWDERDRLGLAGAFVETTRRVLTEPTAFFRQMPVTGGLGSPLLYAVIAGWIGLAAAAFYQAVWGSIVGPGWVPFGPDGGRLPELVDWLEGWTAFVAQVVFGGVVVALGTFITAGILHLMLLLLGGARRGFEASFRVVCYAHATSLLMLVPFCGLLIALGWRLVVYLIGLAEAHQIGYGKATAAVLLPLLLVCCCCAGILFTFAGAIAGLAGHMR